MGLKSRNKVAEILHKKSAVTESSKKYVAFLENCSTCMLIYAQRDVYIHLTSFANKKTNKIRLKKTHEKQLQSPYDFYYPLPAITCVRM